MGVFGEAISSARRTSATWVPTGNGGSLGLGTYFAGYPAPFASTRNGWSKTR